jgi:release factor glutamine methyltransferase
MNSIKTALADAVLTLQSTSESAQLDAELLLCKLLDKHRTYLRTWPERMLTTAQCKAFRQLIDNRSQGRPVAYLTGTREFWSREFTVSPDVLIPRPETELLVELALQHLPVDMPSRILDLGTGSGVIAITLGVERPASAVTATDLSSAALAVARANAHKLGANNVIFLESRWFDAIPPGYFDVIVSNPPYVAENDPHLSQGDLCFEPLTALAAPDNGLADIVAIVDESRQRLVHGGHLLVEHGYEQGPAVQMLFLNGGYCEVQTFMDLAGLPRVTSGAYFAKEE